jgi:hypothetical protein
MWNSPVMIDWLEFRVAVISIGSFAVIMYNCLLIECTSGLLWLVLAVTVCYGDSVFGPFQGSVPKFLLFNVGSIHSENLLNWFLVVPGLADRIAAALLNIQIDEAEPLKFTGEMNTICVVVDSSKLTLKCPEARTIRELTYSHSGRTLKPRNWS